MATKHSEAEVLNTQGSALYRQGRTQEAIPYFEQAITLDPQYWQAHYNLAHSLVKDTQPRRAKNHYEYVLHLHPDHPTAHLNLGLLCLDTEHYDAAVRHLETACRGDPRHWAARYPLAQAHIGLGQCQEAMDALEQVIAHVPEHAEAHHDLAVLYLRAENRSQALHFFQEAVRLQPDNDTARHMICALSGMQTPPTAPTQYVSDLFDQYADYYTAHVQQTLKYQAPLLLRNAVGRCLPQGIAPQRILDLGCGTGLCGIYFRDLALALVGVDVSQKMLEKAEALNTYDALIQMDLQTYLTETHPPFDLVVAADVFVYLGALESVFQALPARLTPGGWFAFTTELLVHEQQRDHMPDQIEHPTQVHIQKQAQDPEQQTDQNTTLFQLQPTGRFAHSPAYIRGLSEHFGWHILSAEKGILRTTPSCPVEGMIYLLQKEEIQKPLSTIGKEHVSSIPPPLTRNAGD